MDEVYYIFHVQKQHQEFTGLLGCENVSQSAQFSVFQRKVSGKSLSNISNNPPNYTVSHPRRLNPQQHHYENFKSDEKCPSNITMSYVHNGCTSITNSIHVRVGTLIVATIYLQLIQNRYMFRSFTVLHCSHQHCVQPVASDVEVVG